MDKLIANYIKYLEEIKHLNPKTIKSYIPAIEEMMQYCGFKSLVDIEESDITILQQWINQKQKEGLGNQSINRRISSCKSFYSFLVAKRYISFNASKELKALKIESKGHAGDINQISKIREYVKNEYDKNPSFNNLRNQLIVEVLLQTAVRNFEVRSLNIDSIKEDGSFAVIQKGNSKKECVINSKAMEIYNKYIEERNKIDAKDNALFISSYKSRLSSKGLEKIIDKITTNAIGQKMCVHDIRHTSATAYVNAGYSCDEVAKILGHSSSNTTFKFYYHMHKNDKKSMAENVF